MTETKHWFVSDTKTECFVSDTHIALIAELNSWIQEKPAIIILGINFANYGEENEMTVFYDE